MGPIIKQSLIAMGYVEKPQVRLTEVAELVTRRTGWRLTKQRLAQILASPTVSPEHLEKIARGLGVSVAELVSGRPKRGEKEEG